MNGYSTVLRFEIRRWNRQRLIDFVNWHINEPLKRHALKLTPEEVMEGVLGFILDFDTFGSREPTLVMDNLEDFIEMKINSLSDDDDPIEIDNITFRRLSMAFNDLAEFISKDVLINFYRTDVRWPAEIGSVQIRRNYFIVTFEEPSRETLW